MSVQKYLRMSKKWSEIFVKFLYPDAVVSIVINIFMLHIYTHNILKYSFNEVKACQCENEETKNNRIGVGTTIERDNRRTSKKFLLSYSFNKVNECQGTLCQRPVLQ